MSRILWAVQSSACSYFHVPILSSFFHNLRRRTATLYTKGNINLQHYIAIFRSIITPFSLDYIYLGRLSIYRFVYGLGVRVKRCA